MQKNNFNFDKCTFLVKIINHSILYIRLLMRISKMLISYDHTLYLINYGIYGALIIIQYEY